MIRTLRYTPFAPALALVLAGAAFAQEPARPPEELAMPRLLGEITLDGALDDAGWKSAVVVDRFFEFSPGEQAPPPVATVGLLAYDAEFLYVGMRCSDPEPAKLRAPWVDRDRVSEQDFVQFDVDARDEGRWSMIFKVNPRGVQADGVFDETVGVDDFSPDFHWESATRIGADGWTAEMRIPLSTLRYRSGDPQTWRITFYRLYPRKYRHSIASMAIPRGSNCWLCHATRFTGITGLGRAASLTATPFVTATASDGKRNAGGGSYDGEESFDGGADFKWQPQPNLAVDATLNPDFSQVEADAPQIAVNSRFALFYPEKRPFFLEGSDLWNSPISAIHTRTITEPDWGLRLTGRPGDASYTLLAAGDRGGGSLIVPGPEGSTFGPQPDDSTIVFGRYRRTFGRSSVAALTTVREGADGYFNRLAGVDFQWYPTTSDRAIGQLLWSSTRDPSEESADDHALFLRWEKNLSHLAWNVQYDELGRDFRADSGFVPQTGIRHRTAYAEYSFYPQGAVRRVWPRIAFDETREIGGGVVSQSSWIGVGIDGWARVTLDWYGRGKERAADGRIFEKSYWSLAARFLPSRIVPYVNVTARWGDMLDIEGSQLGSGADVSLAATISATDRLQAELSAQRQWLDVPGGGGGGDLRLFAASVGRARLTYAFTARSFARVIGEWEALDASEAGGASSHAFRGSALYGYRLNWQSILYLGYGNEPPIGVAGGDGRAQELFVKVAYAFRPRLPGRQASAGAVAGSFAEGKEH